MACSASTRPTRRVVDAAPDSVLDAKAFGVLEHVRDDLIAEAMPRRCRIGDHHVDGQTFRMPPQPIGSNATHVLDLRERQADGPFHENGLDLKSLFAPFRAAGNRDWTSTRHLEATGMRLAAKAIAETSSAIGVAATSSKQHAASGFDLRRIRIYVSTGGEEHSRRGK